MRPESEILDRLSALSEAERQFAGKLETIFSKKLEQTTGVDLEQRAKTRDIAVNFSLSSLRHLKSLNNCRLNLSRGDKNACAAELKNIVLEKTKASGVYKEKSSKISDHELCEYLKSADVDHQVQIKNLLGILSILEKK